MAQPREYSNPQTEPGVVTVAPHLTGLEPWRHSRVLKSQSSIGPPYPVRDGRSNIDGRVRTETLWAEIRIIDRFPVGTKLGTGPYLLTNPGSDGCA